MNRVLVLCFLSLTALPAFAAPDLAARLTPAERPQFHALKVWMTDKEQKQYVRGKTPEARDAWLKSHGLWDRYYQYDALTRQRIDQGEVHIGWTEDQVAMAWGKPADRLRPILTDASTAALLVYRFEVDPSGKVSVWTPESKVTHSSVRKFRTEVLFADGKVRSLTDKEGW